MADTWGPARRWIVRGRVQGVAYRYFTREAARELGLVGWVRNLPDGTVEVQVAGPEDTIETFRRRLRQGPSFARVDGIHEETLGRIPDFDDFEIRF